jgi:hypothetical protein
MFYPDSKDHRYADDFYETRQFLGGQWAGPTLIAFSERSLWPGGGDFILGNRRIFFHKLIRHAEVTPTIKGGHQVQYTRRRNNILAMFFSAVLDIIS